MKSSLSLLVLCPFLAACFLVGSSGSPPEPDAAVAPADQGIQPDKAAASDTGGETPPDADAPALDLAPDPLAEAIDGIRQLAGIPGMAAAVLQGGSVVKLVATGVRKLGDQTPLQTTDRFHLGSDTKAMTATLAALLVEDGLLSWDLTLAEAFPPLLAKMHPDYHDVTLEQLLAHRAGTYTALPAHPDIWGPLWQQDKPVVEQRAWFVEQVLTSAPELPPNTAYAYSNAGYMIAGAIIEAKTGKSWEALMQQRLFDPLKMASCGFGPAGQAGAVTEPWGHRKDGDKLVPVEPGPGADNPPALGPAGTVHCSLADWAKFVAIHVSGARGADNLLPASVYALLHQPRSPDPNPYALGWFVLPRPWAGGNALHHVGSNTMNLANVWAAPAKDTALLVVANCGHDWGLKASDDVVAKLIETYIK